MEQVSIGKYKIICFTDKGKELMKKLFLALSVSGEVAESGSVASLRDWCRDKFAKGNVLVFIGACGIAVRTIAPFIKDKTTDPAVLVMDEKGEYVIPILSGHLGGAVDAGKEIALLTGAVCVQTTATDVEGEFAVDVYAAQNDLVISDMKKAKNYTAELLRTGESSYYIDERFEEYLGLSGIPGNIKRTSKGEAKLIISPATIEESALYLIPKCIVVGMGCRTGKSCSELKTVLLQKLDELGIDARAVRAIASADIKKAEAGLVELCKELGCEFATFGSDTLMAQEGDFTASDYVKKVTGSDNVCERAVAAYGAKSFLSRKKAKDGITFSAGIIDLRK